MVTFSNLMESRGKVEGERGDLSEKMERDLRREGSMKEGESIGLVGKGSTCLGEVLKREGKSSKEKGGRVFKVDKRSEAVGVDKGKLLKGREIKVGAS